MSNPLSDQSDSVRTVLAEIADKAKYLSEPAWTREGCALVGQHIYRLATDALNAASDEDDRG